MQWCAGVSKHTGPKADFASAALDNMETRRRAVGGATAVSAVSLPTPAKSLTVELHPDVLGLNYQGGRLKLTVAPSGSQDKESTNTHCGKAHEYCEPCENCRTLKVPQAAVSSQIKPPDDE